MQKFICQGTIVQKEMNVMRKNGNNVTKNPAILSSNNLNIYMLAFGG